MRVMDRRASLKQPCYSFDFAHKRDGFSLLSEKDVKCEFPVEPPSLVQSLIELFV